VEPDGNHAHYDRPDRSNGSVVFRNVEHLPARNVRWFGDIASNRDREFPIGEMSDGKIVLAPGTTTTKRIGTIFTVREEYTEGRAMGNSVFVWGMVTYDDGFGNERFTRFCHVY